MKTEAKAEPKAEFERQSARVPAKTLYRLLPLLASRDAASLRFGGGQNLWGWRVEPAKDGAIVIATNGTAIGAIFDAEARATAAVTILGSEGLRKAITPPPRHTVYYPGDWDELDLPDEFQPGTVFATSIGVYVTRKADDGASSDDGDSSDDERPMHYSEAAEFGNIWAGGYRLVPEFPYWRRTFSAWSAPEHVSPHQLIAPEILSAFRNITDEPLNLAFSADNAAPVLVRARGLIDFAGLFMRGRDGDLTPTLPDWLSDAEQPPEEAPARAGASPQEAV